jgi:hypothetical protein
MRAEDVLQFVAQAGVRARIAFLTHDRVHGWPRAVDLVIDQGHVVGLGPRGAGLRLGDLLVARGAIGRRALEQALANPAGDGAGRRLGERLAAAGVVAPPAIEDLAWERHARVVWSLLAWDRGTFRVTALEPGDEAGATAVEPPLPIEGVLLDGLQRAEHALADGVPGQGLL